MVVAATQVTVVVAAVVLTVEHRVSLMVIALRVHMVTLRPVPMRIHALKRHPDSKLRQALTPVVRSNLRARPLVATTVATTMIAHHALAVTLVTVATLVALKTVVQLSLIAVVRIRASVLHALIQPHVRTKAVKSVVHLAVIVHMRARLKATVTVMIAQRARLVTVIRVRMLIALPVLTRNAQIASNALSALLLHAANTHHVHAPSVPSHSSVRNVLNTRHVQRERSSMKLVHRGTSSVQQVRLQPHPPMAAIAPLVAQPSRLNTLRR